MDAVGSSESLTDRDAPLVTEVSLSRTCPVFRGAGDTVARSGHFIPQNSGNPTGSVTRSLTETQMGGPSFGEAVPRLPLLRSLLRVLDPPCVKAAMFQGSSLS